MADRLGLAADDAEDLPEPQLVLVILRSDRRFAGDLQGPLKIPFLRGQLGTDAGHVRRKRQLLPLQVAHQTIGVKIPLLVEQQAHGLANDLRIAFS